MSDIDPPQKELVAPNTIFSKIWIAPRQVFLFVDTFKYDKYVTVLLVLSGISRAFDRASVKDMGDKFPLWGVIAFCIFFGGLFGWITYYVYAALISWTGKWLNGKGNTESILRVLSYALIPTIVGLIFLIPQIAVYGNAIFQAEGDLSSAGILGNVLFYFSLFVEILLGVWTVVLCVIGIAVVQKLSIGMALLNFFLPVLLLVSVFLLIFLIGSLV